MQGGDNPINEKQLGILRSSQNFRGYKIVLVVELILITILAIANIAVKVFHSVPSTPASVADFSICEHKTKTDLASLVDNISKDESIGIIKNMYSEDKCALEWLLPESLRLKSNEFAQEILYSYDDADEVPSIAQGSVMGLNTESADDFLIDETTDYYTVVSVDNSKVPCGELDVHQTTISCYRGISFDKNHLDYHETVDGTSHGGEMIFNDLSPDFVGLSLKIIMATDIWNGNSLYDYYLEDTGDSFVLTGIYFGVGVDTNSLENVSAFNIPYAINIYEKKIILDKSTRRMTWAKYDSGYSGETTSNNLKSFSLSDEDLITIQAVIYGISEDELRTQYLDEDGMTDAERLEARVSAICNNNYSVIFRASDNSGIFQCDDYTKAIYSVTNPDRAEENYKNIAYATYLGTDNDATVNEFFTDKLYIYQNYSHSEIPDQLILLLEATAEESLAEDNLDAIYGYVKKLNEEYVTDLVLYVFYTEDLDEVKDLKDYILVTGVAGFYSRLPYGNGFDSYFFQAENEATSLNKLAENPDLYSSQTRDALKFHRHIEAEINNGRDITKDSLRQLLYNSFENEV